MLTGRASSHTNADHHLQCPMVVMAMLVVCLLSTGCTKSSDQAAAPASDATAASAPAAAASDAGATAAEAAAAAAASDAASAAAEAQTKASSLHIAACDVPANDDTADSFPNPVPRPSAWSPPLDTSFASSTGNKPPTFGDIESALNKMLTKAGYDSELYYPFPCGFALVTRIEQTDANWTPLPPPARFSFQTVTENKWSIQSIIEQFVRAKPGFYQIIVFIVSEVPIKVGTNQPPLGFFDKDLKGGANKLSTALERRAANNNVKCTVLVYEFIKENGEQARALSPGELDAMTHLKRASLGAI